MIYGQNVAIYAETIFLAQELLTFHIQYIRSTVSTQNLELPHARVLSDIIKKKWWKKLERGYFEFVFILLYFQGCPENYKDKHTRVFGVFFALYEYVMDSCRLIMTFGF
jgi:hypothetical protein